MTLATTELVDDYLTFLVQRRNRRPLTVNTYRRSLLAFVQHLANTNTALEELTPDDVEDFGWRPLTRGGGIPSAATARKEMVAAKKFLDWLVARRGVQCTAHLDIVMPSMPDRAPNPISDDEWLQLWRSDLCPDDRLWIGDAYWLGRRRCEIVTTTPEGVLLDTQQLRFERKRGKVRQIEYRAPIEWVAAELPWLTEGWEAWVRSLEDTARFRRGDSRLCVYASAEDTFLDGNRLTKRLTMLCQRAGLTEPFGPHRLRHSACTNFFRAGIEPAVIQDLMGHESYDTTRGYMSVSGYLQRGLDKKGKQNGHTLQPRADACDR